MEQISSAKNLNKIVAAVLIALMVLMLFALIFFCACTTYTSDDYYYASFLNDGLGSFVRQNVEHYNVRNGRVLVHIAAEILLSAGFIVFVAVIVLALLLTMYFFARFQGLEKRKHVAVYFAVYTLWIFAFSYLVLKHSFFSVADACNYILPLLPISALAYYLTEKTKENKPRSVVVFVLAFLAAACTEQSGVLAVVIAVLLLIFGRQKNVNVIRQGLPQILGIIAGYLTIFLSPATIERVGAEFSLSNIASGINQLASALVPPGFSLHLLIAFCVIIGLLPLFKKSISKVLLSGIGCAILLSVLYFIVPDITLVTIGFLVFCAFAITASVMLIRSGEYRRSGILILAGGASMLVTAFTSSSSIRVTVPFLLCLGAVTAYFAMEIFYQPVRNMRRKSIVFTAAVLVLAVFTAAVHSTAAKGHFNNYKIKRQNDSSILSAKHTGTLVYKDYELFYCESDLFRSTVFDSAFCGNYGLQDVQIKYTYGLDKPFYGTKLPTIRFNGELYLPLRSVLESMGGSIRWLSDDYLIMTAGERTYTYCAPYIYFGGSKNERVEFTADMFAYESMLYVSERVLLSVFEVSVYETDDGFALEN